MTATFCTTIALDNEAEISLTVTYQCCDAEPEVGIPDSYLDEVYAIDTHGNDHANGPHREDIALACWEHRRQQFSGEPSHDEVCGEVRWEPQRQHAA